MARATYEGSKSHAEAWRDDTNELKEAPTALGISIEALWLMSKVGHEALNLIHDDDASSIKP